MIKIIRTVIICVMIYLSIGKLSSVSAEFYNTDRRLIETSLQEIKTELHQIQLGLRKVIKSNDNIVNEIHDYRRRKRGLFLKEYTPPVVYGKED